MAWTEYVPLNRSHLLETIERCARQALVVPEAVLLFGLALFGWGLGFPTWVLALIVIVICLFGIRLGFVSLAEHYLAHGAYARADRLLRASLHFHPWSADVLLLRAQALLLQGNDEAALPHLRLAAVLSSDRHQLQIMLVTTLFAQGQAIESRRLAEAVDPARPSSPLGMQSLAWIALHINDDPTTAIRLLSQIDHARLPAQISAPLLITLCDALCAVGKYDETLCRLHSVERQLQACPRTQQAELLYHLGRLYAAIGHEGGRHFRRSVELDPQGRYAQVAWRRAIQY